MWHLVELAKLLFLIGLCLIWWFVTPGDAAKYRHHHRHHTSHHARTMPAPAATFDERWSGGSDVISEMRRHLGGNPTGWARVWCGRMLDMALRRTGHAPGSASAAAYAKYGRAASGPAPGVVVVWRHHVGVVTAVPGQGRIQVISGNDGHRVRERVRSTAGVIAWRVP